MRRVEMSALDLTTFPLRTIGLARVQIGIGLPPILGRLFRAQVFPILLQVLIKRQLLAHGISEGILLPLPLLLKVLVHFLQHPLLLDLETLVHGEFDFVACPEL